MITDSQNSTFRVAVVPQPLIFEDCVFYNPPCPDCRPTDVCGGIGYKFIELTVSKILNSKPIYINATGWGEADGPDSVYNLLARAEADTSQYGMQLTYNRSLDLRHSFPVMFSRYVAVIKEPVGKPSSLSLGWTLVMFLIAILTLHLILYAIEMVALRTANKTIHHNFHASFKVIKASSIIFNLFLAASFAYFGSAVTILFYKRPPKLPFDSFSGLAVLLGQQKFKPLVLYNITIQSLFRQPMDGKVQEMLAEAYTVNKPKMIIDIDTAIRMVFSSTPSTQYVLITPDDYSLTIIREKYCGFTVIPDKSELPWEMNGYYFSNQYNPRYNWYQREIMKKDFIWWVRRYVRGDARDTCKNRVPVGETSQIVNLWQVWIVFKLMIFGSILSVAGFLSEAVVNKFCTAVSLRKNVNYMISDFAYHVAELAIAVTSAYSVHEDLTNENSSAVVDLPNINQIGSDFQNDKSDNVSTSSIKHRKLPPLAMKQRNCTAIHQATEENGNMQEGDATSGNKSVGLYHSFANGKR